MDRSFIKLRGRNGAILRHVINSQRVRAGLSDRPARSASSTWRASFAALSTVVGAALSTSLHKFTNVFSVRQRGHGYVGHLGTCA